MDTAEIEITRVWVISPRDAASWRLIFLSYIMCHVWSGYDFNDMIEKWQISICYWSLIRNWKVTIFVAIDQLLHCSLSHVVIFWWLSRQFTELLIWYTLRGNDECRTKIINIVFEFRNHDDRFVVSHSKYPQVPSDTVRIWRVFLEFRPSSWIRYYKFCKFNHWFVITDSKRHFTANFNENSISILEQRLQSSFLRRNISRQLFASHLIITDDVRTDA